MLDVIADYDRTQRAGSLSVPFEDGRLLRILAESSGATRIVEIGTSFGYSGLWLALALRGTSGRLTTFDIDPERQARARTNFERAGVLPLITLVAGDAHEKVRDVKGPIDYVFSDADKDGYLDYFQKLSPLLRPGGSSSRTTWTRRRGRIWRRSPRTPTSTPPSSTWARATSR